MVTASGVMLPLVRHSGTRRSRAYACFRYGYVVIASLCVACATPAPPGAENVSAATATMADTDLQAYQLRALETHIQKMPDGPERDYFSGMLAARSGQFGDAVAQLNRALPLFVSGPPNVPPWRWKRSRPPTGLTTIRRCGADVFRTIRSLCRSVGSLSC